MVFAFRDMVLVESPELATTFPTYHTCRVWFAGIVSHAGGTIQRGK